VKLINSAASNAENNFNLDKEKLYISEITVNEGPTLKRWMPRAYGRATQILKRTSKVQIVLEERESEAKSKAESRKPKAEKKEKVEKAKVPTEGSAKTETKVVNKKEKVSTEVKEKHKKVEGSKDRVLSREPGTAKKVFKKTKDKK
jgi:hypothetical protein